MDRIERAQQKYAELFGEGQPVPYTTDPDFQQTFPDFEAILSRFIFGEVFYQGSLTIHQRELITLVVMTTNQTLPQLRAHLGAALNVGLTPEEIREALYQCAPYIGFPKTLNALAEYHQVLKERNIPLPLEDQKQTSEDDRLEQGLRVQTAIFGDVIRQMRENAPENQKHIQDYLSAFDFGDIYTRGGLDLPTRELLTLCVLSALGGCESQVKSHVQGNLNVGNDKNLMIDALTQCLPYIGFPRTLNALQSINEVA